MARVILFGAGASFGAGDVYPVERPPLGDQLFGELARCYPGSWGALPPDIHLKFREKGGFELGMAMLWERHSPAVPTLMQEMALYFLQFRPREPGSTLYCSLAKAIKESGTTNQVLLSTLNYECLLEGSIARQSMQVNYGDFPGSDGSVTVWKLHGSCNFLPEGIQATRGVSFTRGVLFETAVRAVGDLNEAVAFCLGDNALPPVMCLFMEGKPTQVAPGTVAAIQEAWRGVVAKAEKVALVGVGPNPADAHLWDALATMPGSLVYVGNEGKFWSWARVHRAQGESKVIADSFNKGIEQLIDEIVR